jgi:ParB family chromosome partitioning protein
MELKHIEIADLTVSSANMRGGRRSVDIANILPSVRARGILVPLIVRPAGGEGAYEIVAGKRRYHAALAVAEENGAIDPLPCAVMEAGDDAAALEASLIENIARLDPDEVTRWETFTRLVKEGRTPEDISLTFGLAELQVKRTLALGNLLPRIRNLYRAENIDAATVRHLTLATKAQQREWLALFDDEGAYAPTGQQLKAWLFGGASISTNVALFDLASYPGQIVCNLFGEDGYFADAEEFWEAQRAAIEGRRAAYLEAGWSDVVIVPPHDYFQSYEYEKTPKRKSGKVYITVSARGEVTFHEGYVSRKEARRARKAAQSGEDGEALSKPSRPEVSSTMQTYIDLHRHAAVRARLTEHVGVALRLMVAHAISGSYLFRVQPDPQRSGNELITESVETSASETTFDAKRRAALALLDFDPEAETVTGCGGYAYGTAGLFARLLALTDDDVLSILAIVMGESLEAGSDVVEAVGLHLGVDMAPVWTPDEAFFELLRDKSIVTALLADIAGEAVAKANAGEKVKVQKRLIRDHLEGANGRPKVEGWLPRWMAFPPAPYTERGGFRTALLARQVAPLFEPSCPSEPQIEVGPVREAA